MTTDKETAPNLFCFINYQILTLPGR